MTNELKKHKCCTTVNDKVIVTKDLGSGRRSHRLQNLDRIEVLKVKVDGCLIGDEFKKCDWLIVAPQRRKAYYIEIKGVDIRSALEQVIVSIESTREWVTGFELFVRIVISKYSAPRIQNSPRYLRLMKLLGSRNNLIIREGCIDEALK